MFLIRCCRPCVFDKKRERKIKETGCEGEFGKQKRESGRDVRWGKSCFSSVELVISQTSSRISYLSFVTHGDYIIREVGVCSGGFESWEVIILTQFNWLARVLSHWLHLVTRWHDLNEKEMERLEDYNVGEEKKNKMYGSVIGLLINASHLCVL